MKKIEDPAVVLAQPEKGAQSHEVQRFDGDAGNRQTEQP